MTRRLVNVGPAVTPDQRVTEFFAWIAIHANGGEGTVAVMTVFGLTPACSGSKSSALVFEPLVRASLRASLDKGSPPQRIELRRFGLTAWPADGEPRRGFDVVKVVTP